MISNAYSYVIKSRLRPSMMRHIGHRIRDLLQNLWINARHGSPALIVRVVTVRIAMMKVSGRLLLLTQRFRIVWRLSKGAQIVHRVGLMRG